MLSLILVMSAVAAETTVPPEVRAYLDQRITVERYVTPAGFTTRVDYLQNDRLLFGYELYELLERPDLAEKWKERNAQNWGLGLGGAAAVVLGFALPSVGRGVFGEDTTGASISTLLGAGMVLGGGVCVVIPVFRRAHPAPRDEISWMIQQHNAQLAAELGVSPASQPPSTSR